MEYQPPQDLWEVHRRLNFDQPLKADDPLYVDVAAGRGAFSFDPLLKSLGIDPRRDDRPLAAQARSYALFCGHRGCGKSTELRRLAQRATGKERYLVLLLDATLELDPNNLHYADVLLALAKTLFERLEAEKVSIEQVYLTNLENWFSERIAKREKTREFATQLRAGAKVQVGLPWLGKLFGGITAAIKGNSSYKEELRRITRDSYSEFAAAFNLLIGATEEAVRSAGMGEKLLFIIDGTDRLTGDDSKRFFIDDAYQLQAIRANFIYCAPIPLLYEQTQALQSFRRFALPMIKIAARGAPKECFEPGCAALRELLYLRAPRALFDSEQSAERLIAHSGGNPRELLRLLDYAFQRSESDRFDDAAVEAAINELATDYRRFLEPDDYALLHALDRDERQEENSERMRRLLYNLAALEYSNGGYWRGAHPVIRRLKGYRDLDRAAQ